MLANILALQAGVAGLDVGWYKRAKAKGIAALRISKGQNQETVREFQSGVTTSLTDGEKEINVRRFSFYAQDSLVKVVARFSKQLLTPSLKGDIVTQVESLIESWFGPPVRISGKKTDWITGNTATLSKRGIFVGKIWIEMIEDARVILFDTRIGLGVLEVTSTVLPLAA